MDQETYLQTLIDFGSRMVAPGAHPDARATYLSTLTGFGRRLLVERSPVADQALDEFRQVIMPNVQHLLWRVAGATQQRRLSLGPEQRRMLDVLDVHPDLLGPLAQTLAETSHTRLLAFFLDAKATSLGRLCRDAFVQLLLHPSGAEAEQPLLSELDLDGARVMAERYLGERGRVDVCLDGPGALLFLEVKINAEERPGQLSDYGSAIESLALARPRLLVFLTRDPGQKPRTPSAQRHITFRDLLRAWLPIAASGRSAEHDYLARYLKTIAVHLYELAHHGEFERWPLQHQRSMLSFLMNEGGTS